jgi:hypothetical protein
MNNLDTKKMVKNLLMTVALVAAAPALAAEMDHGMNHNMDQKMDHSAMQGKMQKSALKPSPGLEKLAQIPTSGRARESGSDGRSVMESIDISNSQATRCAQATRGLVMLDNAAWSRCGGKPEGAAHGPQAAGAKGAVMKGHAGHNM